MRRPCYSGWLEVFCSGLDVLSLEAPVICFGFDVKNTEADAFLLGFVAPRYRRRLFYTRPRLLNVDAEVFFFEPDCENSDAAPFWVGILAFYYEAGDIYVRWAAVFCSQYRQGQGEDKGHYDKQGKYRLFAQSCYGLLQFCL